MCVCVCVYKPLLLFLKLFLYLLLPQVSVVVFLAICLTSVKRSSFFFVVVDYLFYFLFHNHACLSHCREFNGSNLFLPSLFNFVSPPNLLFIFPAVPRAQKLRSPLEKTPRYQRFSIFGDDVPSFDLIYLLITCMPGGDYLT